MAQWSDLVVFDFLTGNYDRVSSMQVHIIIVIIIIIIIIITIGIYVCTLSYHHHHHHDFKYFLNIFRQIWFQDTAEKEGQPEILSETVHNLAKSSQTGFYIISIITILIMITSSTSSGGLWLLDNESGLFDAYTLLFPSQEMGPAAQNEALRWPWQISINKSMTKCQKSDIKSTKSSSEVQKAIWIARMQS